MSNAVANKFGRKPGRGIRPWILIPKIIAVGLYIGSATAATAFWFINRVPSMPATDPKRLWVIDNIKYMLEAVAVPGLLLAIILGCVLLAQHPKEFFRMRWLKVKLVSIIVLIPSAHFFNATRIGLMREAFQNGTTAPSAELQFSIGMIIALVGSLWIVVVGRLKPRLGQKHALSHLQK